VKGEEGRGNGAPVVRDQSRERLKKSIFRLLFCHSRWLLADGLFPQQFMDTVVVFFVGLHVFPSAGQNMGV
jgi:hypothetical protein